MCAAPEFCVIFDLSVLGAAARGMGGASERRVVMVKGGPSE